MPYITQDARWHAKQLPADVGELTYAISYLIENYRQFKGDHYQTFAEIVAACEQAKDEFQRQVVHPYEDRKLLENGEVHAADGGWVS